LAAAPLKPFDNEWILDAFAGRPTFFTTKVFVTYGGTVKGDQIAFTEPLNFQGQEVPITYTGTIAGDEITFTRKVGDFATEQLVAKRKKD